MAMTVTSRTSPDDRVSTRVASGARSNVEYTVPFEPSVMSWSTSTACQDCQPPPSRQRTSTRAERSPDQVTARCDSGQGVAWPSALEAAGAAEAARDEAIEM